MIYQCILGQSFWLKWPEHNPRPRLELPCWYAAQYVLCKYSPVVCSISNAPRRSRIPGKSAAVPIWVIVLPT